MTNPSDKLKVAIVQLCSIDDVSQNQTQVLNLLNQLPMPVDVVFLPENSLFMRIGGANKPAALSVQDEVYRPFQEWAKKHTVELFFGANPTETENGVENATVRVRADGAIEHVYSKIHLFDVDVKGHKPVRESDQFVAGAKAQIVDVKGWRMGLSICHDVRFAELYSLYAKQAVDAIVVPAAFLVPTGRAHWHVLLRARAIENQCYVVAAAQAGRHKSVSGEERDSFGHSLVVDPWGEVLVDLAEPRPDFAVVTLERERIRQVRAQIPMASHRKL